MTAQQTRRTSGNKSRRRVTAIVTLLFALILFGAAYAAVLPSAQPAQAASTDPALVAKGEGLYKNSCITCHGGNLEGVKDRGPSLIGVGEAATYFQLSTGRMPAAENAAQMPRRKAFFTPEEIDAIGAYVQSNGGGPTVPRGQLQDPSAVALGGELYRLNCASCHNFTGQGGALSQGKYAPPLSDATDTEIYTAMLSGPENMPKFADSQLTPDEKKAIITFIQNNKQTIDPGGAPLGGFGPAPEGLIAFIVGMVALVGVTMWIGAKA